MGISGNDQFNEQIRQRTLKLAVDVRNLLAFAKVRTIDKPALQQLIRSSSSVAANYRSATRGRSDAEFFSKISIVLEEADETLFWLEYFLQIGVLNETEAMSCLNDTGQLVRLFATIRKRMKEKMEKDNSRK
jgi:four helix bundle protein